MKLAGLVFFIFVVHLSPAPAQWIKQPVNTAAGFRGLSVVNEKIIWASGTGGTVIKTVDGGKNWKVMTVPGAEKLDFRDIEAFDANTAYILSIGNGETSRIYKTTDGGATWKLQFTNKDAKAFYDAIACWSRSFCLAMSDPVDGRFRILSTVDAGATWKLESRFEGPAAREGEAAFAASGTCLIATPDSKAFLLVSGGTAARVFRGSRRSDGGISWQPYDTPITKGTSGSGIFSIAMRDNNNGVVVGGNYEKPFEAIDNLAVTADGGKSWRLVKGISGYRSAVAYVDPKTLIAVGTNGTDISKDGGATWRQTDNEDLNAVAAKGPKAVWAVGQKGTVVKWATGTEVEPPGGWWPHVLRVSEIRLSRVEVSSTCGVDPACTQIIEVATVTADVPNLKFLYTVSRGRIIGDGANVSWDLSGLKSGTYKITVGVDDGRGVGQTVTKEVRVIE